MQGKGDYLLESLEGCWSFTITNMVPYELLVVVVVVVVDIHNSYKQIGNHVSPP